MLFSNYQLEILVNDQPLEECEEPIGTGRTTTGPSYVLNEFSQRRLENKQTVYAAVTKLGVQFKIRYKIPYHTIFGGPIMAFVYVDGLHDNTYSAHTSLSSIQNIREGFYNYARGKIYNFKFDVTLWGNDEGYIIPNTRAGGQGAVSVYFYRAMHLHQIVKPRDINIKSAKVSEGRADLGLKLSTSFNEETIPIQQVYESLLAPASLQPLAVLHLHYRTTSWLMSRNLLRPVPIINRTYTLSEIRNNNLAIKTEDVKNVIGKKGKAKEQEPRGIKRRIEQRGFDESDTEDFIKIVDGDYFTIKYETEDQVSFEQKKRRR
ncbi:12383_t:CDS:1 [Acaulospora morrowiae]|uniref:12383_t:CDS:1 n=1 Tax=Acaulospora morrowiae TaxID=94023 RepID=A0A9N9HEV7_9GLOM|nr:12383_t:CDS:1 [Acaulospora morrowiae]